MRVTDTTREQLRCERIRRRLLQDGYEQVGEGGGMLWELYRGKRQGHRIVDAAVDPAGKSVWVRIVPPDTTR